MGRMGAEDPSTASGRVPHLVVPVGMAVVASVSAGVRAAERATIVQLRDPGVSARAFEASARELVAASPVPVLISSRCDVALAAGAAGVNLPERDITVADARVLAALAREVQRDRRGGDDTAYEPRHSIAAFRAYAASREIAEEVEP